jgi:uncharacterized delta-60 repeat protein
VVVEGLPEDVRITSLAADREGRIVATLEGHSYLSVARMDRSGVLDPSFGVGGIYRLGLRFGDGAMGELRSLDSVVVMADGSIRIGGDSAYATSPAVFGIDAEGYDDGWRIPAGAADTSGAAISLMDQDGALVVGFGSDGVVEDLVRYTAAGERDPAFPPTPAERATAIAPGGGFVMAGTSVEPAAIRFFARRVLRDGQPDPSFGGGAPAFVPEASGIPDRSTAVASSAAGGLILAGVAGEADRRVLLVARFDAAGRLDPGFGAGRGFATHDVLGTGDVRAVVEAAGGAIVVAGTFGDDTGGDLGSYAAAVRLTPDGSLDRSFGRAGVLVAHVGSSLFSSIVALPDGDVVAGGAVIGASHVPLFARL